MDQQLDQSLEFLQDECITLKTKNETLEKQIIFLSEENQNLTRKVESLDYLHNGLKAMNNENQQLKFRLDAEKKEKEDLLELVENLKDKLSVKAEFQDTDPVPEFPKEIAQKSRFFAKNIGIPEISEFPIQNYKFPTSESQNTQKLQKPTFPEFQKFQKSQKPQKSKSHEKCQRLVCLGDCGMSYHEKHQLPCKFQKLGTCTKGGGCEFSHWCVSIVTGQNCRFGDKCHFNH